MRPMDAAIAVAFVLALAITASSARSHRRHLSGFQTDMFYNYTCAEAFGASKVSVLMVADPGTFSGTPEDHFVAANLKGYQPIKPSNNVCPRKGRGTLMGQPVVLVTTGIGPEAAALCAMEILQCSNNIKEIIYMGTSGWSPAFGGILNAGNCSSTNPTNRITRIGDVCVSPFSVNWMCKKASWNEQCLNGTSNICVYPEESSGPDAAYLYGECVFSQHAAHQMELAAEIKTAATSSQYKLNVPKPNSAVQDWGHLYWGSMTNLTGVNYMKYLNYSAPPSVYGSDECVEADGQFFYSGAPYEMVCRNYTAMTLNMAMNSTRFTPYNVICVSAMEAIGIAAALQTWKSIDPSHADIPYVAVRGASNWLHNPVKPMGGGVWVDGVHVPELFTEGYAYAIATETTAVLTTFQNRCNTAKLGNCTFNIDYK